MNFLKNRFIFRRLQSFCRWYDWNIDKFPVQSDWDIKSFKCNLLGFILGSQKCPNCNKVDYLFQYESYDALTIFCKNCNAEYYKCAPFEDFGIHSAAIVRLV